MKYLKYIQEVCEQLIPNTYPNQSYRLQQLLSLDIAQQKIRAEKLATRINKYHEHVPSGHNTWKQLYSQLSELDADVQFLRIQELPAYLASSPSDYYLSKLLEALHTEVGLIDSKPVVSLWQGTWFATLRRIPTAPLYFMPYTIASDLSELPLIFHEMGHILFSMWSKDLYQFLEDVFEITFQRKFDEINAEMDPTVRQMRETDFMQMRPQMINEIEELVCDIIGVFLGGEAFVIALSVGLFCSDDNPYDSNFFEYPPLDCRMRIGNIVLGILRCNLGVLENVNRSWAKVQALYLPARWYHWIYDDQYLFDLATAVKDFLESKNILLYKEHSGDIREDLTMGLRFMLNDSNKHQEWILLQSKKFSSLYTPSKSSS